MFCLLFSAKCNPIMHKKVCGRRRSHRARRHFDLLLSDLWWHLEKGSAADRWYMHVCKLIMLGDGNSRAYQRFKLCSSRWRAFITPLQLIFELPGRLYVAKTNRTIKTRSACCWMNGWERVNLPSEEKRKTRWIFHAPKVLMRPTPDLAAISYSFPVKAGLSS